MCPLLAMDEAVCPTGARPLCEQGPPRWGPAVTEQVVGGSGPAAARGIGVAPCPGLRQYWRHGQSLHSSRHS